MELYINTDALPEGYDINFHSREEWRSIHRNNEGFLLVTPAGVKSFDIPQHHRSDVYDLMHEERQLAVWALAIEQLKKVPAKKNVRTLAWVSPSCGLAWDLFASTPDLHPGATVKVVRKALRAKLAKYTKRVPAEPVKKEVSIRIRKKDLKKVRFADSAGTFFGGVVGTPESDKSFYVRAKGVENAYVTREELNRSIFRLPFEQRFLAVAALLKIKLDKLPEGTLVRSVEIYNFREPLEGEPLDGAALFLPSAGFYTEKPRTVDTWCAVVDSVLHMYTKPDAKEVEVELTSDDLARVEVHDFDHHAPFDTFDVHCLPDIGFTVTFLDGTKKKFTPKDRHHHSIYNGRFEDRIYAVAALAAEKAKSQTRSGLVTVKYDGGMGEARREILGTANNLLLPLTIEGINDLLEEKFKIKTVE
jgi:hypothetical protein